MGSLFATIQSNPTTAVMAAVAAFLIGGFFYSCARYLVALGKHLELSIVEAVTPDARPPRLLGSRRPPITASALRRRA